MFGGVDVGIVLPFIWGIERWVPENIENLII
jgi:hypothetical protein